MYIFNCSYDSKFLTFLLYTNNLFPNRLNKFPDRSNKTQSVLWFYFCSWNFNHFPCLIRENKSHQLNAAINYIIVQECMENLTKLRVMLHSLPGYSVNKSCFGFGFGFVFLKTPLPIMLSIMLLPLQLILHPGFPSFFCHLPGLFIQSSKLSFPYSFRRVGWPIKHSHSRLGSTFRSDNSEQSLLQLLCLPRESQGGSFWRRHVFKYKRLCVACKEPPGMSPIDPHQFKTEVTSKGADFPLPEQSLALTSSKVPCEHLWGWNVTCVNKLSGCLMIVTEK